MSSSESSSEEQSDTVPITWNQDKLAFQVFTRNRIWGTGEKISPNYAHFSQEHQKWLWLACHMPDLDAEDVAKITKMMPYKTALSSQWSIERQMYVAKRIERMSRNPPPEQRAHWEYVKSENTDIERQIAHFRDRLDTENLTHYSRTREGIVMQLANNRWRDKARKFGLRQQKFIYHAFTNNVSRKAIAQALPAVGFDNPSYIKMRMYPKFVAYIDNQWRTGTAEERAHWGTVRHLDPDTTKDINDFIDQNDRRSKSPRRSPSREPVYRRRGPEYPSNRQHRADRDERPSSRLPKKKEKTQKTQSPYFRLLDGKILEYHPGGSSIPRSLTESQQRVIWTSCQEFGCSTDEALEILSAHCHGKNEKKPSGINANDIGQIVKYMGEKLTDPHTGVGHHWTDVTRSQGWTIDEVNDFIEKDEISKAYKTQSSNTTKKAGSGGSLGRTGASRTARSDQSSRPPTRHEPFHQNSRSPSLSPAPQGPPRRRQTRRERAKELGYDVVESIERARELGYDVEYAEPEVRQGPVSHFKKVQPRIMHTVPFDLEPAPQQDAEAQRRSVERQERESERRRRKEREEAERRMGESAARPVSQFGQGVSEYRPPLQSDYGTWENLTQTDLASQGQRQKGRRRKNH